jgi:hypothetical protein
MKNKILNTLTLVSAILALEIIVILVTSLYWQHQAIVHHAAFFEASSWGNVSFHWYDESFAQTPFQDAGWEKIQNNLFQKKLDALNIK